MKNKIFTILSIVGLLFSLARQLPIWPGPLIYRHLTPEIIGGILIVIACLGTMKEGSNTVGIIGLFHGILATLGGGALLYYFITASVGTSPYNQIILMGTIIAFIVSISSIFFGYRTYKAEKSK